MKKKLALLLTLVVSLAAIMGCLGCAAPAKDAASSYPSKDITFIVNKAPGGGSDVVTRIIASALEPVLGVNCVVLNKEGGDGVIGLNEYIKAEPNGYTLSVVGPNEIVNSIVNSEEAAFTEDDFIPVATFNLRGFLLAVKPDSPFKSIEDLKAYAAANPGAVTVGIPGNANKQLALDVMDSLGVEMTIVNSGSGGEVFAGVLGGHLEAGLLGAQFYQRVIDGNASVLAQTVETREMGLAEVPTMKELGYDFNYDVRMMLTVPKGTPEYVIDKLNETLDVLFADDAFKQSLVDAGESPYYVYKDEVKEYYDWFCKDQIPKLTETRDSGR